MNIIWREERNLCDHHRHPRILIVRTYFQNP